MVLLNNLTTAAYNIKIKQNFNKYKKTTDDGEIEREHERERIEHSYSNNNNTKKKNKNGDVEIAKFVLKHENILFYNSVVSLPIYVTVIWALDDFTKVSLSLSLSLSLSQGY